MKPLLLFLIATISASCSPTHGPSETPSGSDQPQTPALSASVEPSLTQRNDACCWGILAGGLLNKKAIFLPEPDYPKSLRDKAILGRVTVQVLVDKTGAVVSASAVSGPKQLHPFAVSSARKAKFEPVYINGEPREFSGVIVYDFPPRKS